MPDHSENVRERVARVADGQDRRQGARDRVESVLGLAEHLPEDDRLLLRQVYELGLTVPQIARQMQRPRGQVYRRVQRVLRRMGSPLFRYVAGHQRILPAELRPVATHCVLSGLSVRRAADRSRMTLHEIRSRLQALKMLARM